MIKDNLIETLTLLLVLLSANSVSGQNAVKIVDSVGKESYFLLDSYPSVTFDGEEVNIETENEIVSYYGESLLFEFCDYDNNSVALLDESSPCYKLTKTVLEVYNLIPHSFLKIYDSTGKTIYTIQIEGNGNASIPIENFGTGVYIISSNNSNLKFYKK